MGFDTSSTDGVLAMIDLNGDGLPDKVFRQNGQSFFRLNTTKPGGQVTFSDQAVPCPAAGDLPLELEPVLGGAEAYFGVNVFANQSEATTASDAYFQDVNGDGLPDLVANGQVLFNHLDASGVPVFAHSAVLRCRSARGGRHRGMASPPPQPARMTRWWTRCGCGPPRSTGR